MLCLLCGGEAVDCGDTFECFRCGEVLAKSELEAAHELCASDEEYGSEYDAWLDELSHEYDPSDEEYDYTYEGYCDDEYPY